MEKAEVVCADMLLKQNAAASKVIHGSFVENRGGGGKIYLSEENTRFHNNTNFGYKITSP
jgi:hypothetical protein